MEDQTTQRSLNIVLLAAGLSRRLSGEQKLLKLYNDKPLFLYSLSAALEFADVVLVTGHESERVTSAAKEFISRISAKHSLKCVKNIHYEQGQYTSALCGIQNIEKDADFALSVSDAPFVTPNDYKKLYSFLSDSDIVRPFVNSTPCHPVFFKSSLKNMFLDNSHYQSVRSLINDNKDKLKIYNCDYKDNPKLCVDFDYAECFKN